MRRLLVFVISTKTLLSFSHRLKQSVNWLLCSQLVFVTKPTSDVQYRLPATRSPGVEGSQCWRSCDCAPGSTVSTCLTQAPELESLQTFCPATNSIHFIWKIFSTPYLQWTEVTWLTNYKVNITLNIPPGVGSLSAGLLTDVYLTNMAKCSVLITFSVFFSIGGHVCLLSL